MMVAAGMMGVMMVPIANMATMTATNKAQLEATILFEAEIDRFRRLWSVDQREFEKVSVSSERCVISDEKGPDGSLRHGYTADGEGFNVNVSCTVGRTTVGGEDVILSFPVAQNNPGNYQDTNRDGFEDVTGLPTHYDQCYAGWKGSSFKTTACELGGQFVIPMYSDIYEQVEYTPGVYCPSWDPDGSGGYNNDHNVVCNPYFNR